jgi:hypothetical protein
VYGDEPEAVYRAEHETVAALLGLDRAESIAGSYIDLVSGAG